MSRTFELFHISLKERAQIDMFVGSMSREESIRAAFAEGLQFVHFKKDFYWVPKKVDGGDVIGIVERQKPRKQHRPPEQGGAEFVDSEWQGAVVIIDPTAHEDGQRVAFEFDQDVGKPWTILEDIIDAINSKHIIPYIMEVKPIFDGNDFWAFASKHNQVVKKITFDFVVPNMWGTKKKLDKELKGTGDDTGAQKVKITLDGADGVKADSQRVKDGVEYAQKGGASISATALDGDKFRSTDKITSTRVGEEDLEEADSVTIWQKLANRILRRE